MGGITNATSAANSAVRAAEQGSRGDRGKRPSVITVEILGYGQERLVPEQDRNAGAPDYRPDGVVRVLGAGELSDCPLSTSPSPRARTRSRLPSSAGI